MEKLSLASFFTGIGGFDLGFQNAGFQIVFQCEKDRFCNRVLSKHWPSVTRFDDIKNVSHEDVPYAKVWAAGFPCQDLSTANQGRRKGLNGERSGLFNVFARLVEKAKPEWVLLENVPGLLNSAGGEDFRAVLNTLDEIGYGVAWRIFNAKYFGTPQERRRVFITASYQSARSACVFSDGGTIGEMGCQGGAQKGVAAGTESGNHSANLYFIQHASIGRKDSAGPQGKGWKAGESYTLDSRGCADVVCAPYDGFRVRGATGFPGELDRRRLKAVGNAVNVSVAEWIARRIAFVIQ